MIAISYRRQDSNPVAGRLYDRLQAEFGKGAVFMDFDSIPYGVDFREHIKSTLRRAKVIVAIIGPDWVGAKDKSDRRIDDPSDFVRLEIASALESNIPIIPVLINNTPMPDARSLPPELEALAFRNGLALDTGIDFHHHADRLIAGIHKVVDPYLAPPLVLPAAPALATSRSKGPVILGGLALAVVLAGIAAWYFLAPKEQAKNAPSKMAATPMPTASIAVTASTTKIKPAEPAALTPTSAPTLSASPSSAPLQEEANVTGKEYTFTGKVGMSEAVFHLRFENGDRVSGNYTHGSSTYRLEGTHPFKNRLSLDEYTGEKITAHLDLTRANTINTVHWEGTMRNTPPDNRTFRIWFERPFANTIASVPPATSSPGENNEAAGEYTYSGKIGAADAIFRLKFEGPDHVTGTYTCKGATYRLEGRHPKGKLLLDEYTQDRLSAHLNLTRTESASDLGWEGTMHNTPPDNRVFKVFFSRPRQ
ncbi:MAG: hypothetical protein QOD12_828 [Verrucomicrobiota bacterium]|jgi:hypothetical protein